MMIFLAFIAAIVLGYGISAGNEWAAAAGGAATIAFTIAAIIFATGPSIPEDE